jgi:hypothetical protein
MHSFKYRHYSDKAVHSEWCNRVLSQSIIRSIQIWGGLSLDGLRRGLGIHISQLDILTRQIDEEVRQKHIHKKGDHFYSTNSSLMKSTIDIAQNRAKQLGLKFEEE